MLRNYLKIAFRNFRKRKLNSFVIVTGMVVSLAFCLLMFLYVDGALRWDQSHPDWERTHLYTMDYFQQDDVDTDFSLFDFSEKPFTRYSLISYIHARDFMENIPELKESTLFYDIGTRWKSDVKINGNVFREAISSSDDNFLDFIDYKWVAGNVEEAMKDPKTLVISEGLAKRHFGKVDVLDETIQVIFKGEPEEFKIGAVVDIPQKSTFKFDILMNLMANKNIGDNLFRLQSNVSFQMLTRLPHGVSAESASEKLQTYFEKKYAEYIESKRRWTEVSPGNPVFDINLVNVSDIHLDPHIKMESNAKIQHILLVGLFAVVLLVVSGINYLLISLAMLSGRISEISIRRISGAQKSHVLLQFWLENALTLIISLLMAICVLQFAIPFIEEKTETTIFSTFPQLFKAGSFLVAVLILVSLLISLKPTRLISRLKLSDTLKGNKTSKLKTGFVNWMVTIQFILCFGFIITGLVMNNQMKYMLNKDLGFDQEQVIIVRNGSQELKQSLLSNPEFSHAARAGGWLFGHGLMTFINKVDGKDLELIQYDAEPDMLELLDLDIEWLDTDYGDELVAIVNEKAADLIGREKLAETKVGMRQRVVGIIHNTDFQPFTVNNYEYYYLTPNTREERRLRQTFVKIQAGQMQAGLKKLEEVWYDLYPNNALQYDFLDEYISENYDSYLVTTNLINFITFLGVVISCLGLFALNGIIAQNKLKEIGIRKILGASIGQIMKLLNTRVMLILSISALIAIPITHELLSDWLNNFSAHISLSWYYFAIAIIIGLLVSLSVLMIHTIKAATVNPAELIKEE